jgi:hypothetical protein
VVEQEKFETLKKRYLASRARFAAHQEALHRSVTRTVALVERAHKLAMDAQTCGSKDVALAEGTGVHRAATGTGAILVQFVFEQLSKARRPLHISELVQVARTRGVPVPGAGKQANLISHLMRDDRFVRPSRGMYALRRWGTPTTKKEDTPCRP